jgi:hypothetical protein
VGRVGATRAKRLTLGVVLLWAALFVVLEAAQVAFGLSWRDLDRWVLGYTAGSVATSAWRLWGPE